MGIPPCGCSILKIFARIEVSEAVKTQVEVFWIVTSCSVVV
jgi:hypothetical protein